MQSWIVSIILIAFELFYKPDAQNPDGEFTAGIPSESESESRLNILWMVLDDIGWADISYNDHHAEYTTPHIADLMSSGIELNNYYVHATCTPTRSAFLTGQYAFSLGLQYVDTMPIGTTEHIPYTAPTIMELLKMVPNGVQYKTEMIGKWHLGYASRAWTPIGRGFDNHYGFYQDAQNYYNHTVISPKPAPLIELPTGYDFWDNWDPDWSVRGTYSTDIFHNRFESVISAYATKPTPDHKPLFMYMAFQTVHTPMQYPPINFTAQCDHIPNENRRVYCLKVVYQDYIIGRMIRLYKDLGLWDNTLVILTTDNGGMVDWSNRSRIAGGVSQSYGCNMPYRGGKATLYEGGMKAVGAISGGVIPEHLRGSSSNVLMHAIDWAPTIIGALGYRIDGLFDGEDVLDYLVKGKPINEHNENRLLYLDIEKNGSFAAVRQGNYKYFTGPRNDAAICRLEGLCLAYHGYYPCNQSAPYDIDTNGIDFVYDIINDPYEENNLRDTPIGKEKIEYFKNKTRERIHTKYMEEQNSSFHFESLPIVHGGVWAPWL